MSRSPPTCVSAEMRFLRLQKCIDMKLLSLPDKIMVQEIEIGRLRRNKNILNKVDIGKRIWEKFTTQ